MSVYSKQTAKMEMQKVDRYPTNFTTVRQRRNVNWVLVVSLVFIIAGVVLACVAVGTDYWVTSFNQYAGLWKRCVVDLSGSAKCISREDELSSPSNANSWIFILICRILLLVAVGLSGLSLLLVALALCHKATRCCAITSGVLLIFASLATGAVVALFVVGFIIAAASSNQSSQSFKFQTQLGYSFMMCAAADGLFFIAGILGYIGACVERSMDTPGVVLSSVQ